MKVDECYIKSFLAYNLGRTSINGCDFSLDPYVYVEDGDADLKTFNMEREDKYVVPFIKQAGEEAGEDIRFRKSSTKS